MFALLEIARIYKAVKRFADLQGPCLLYTSDAADEEDSVDLGGRRILNSLFSLACFSKARILKCCSVFFFRWDLVCRSRVPSEDRGNLG